MAQDFLIMQKVSYTPSTSMDPTTLTLARYSNGTWQTLNDCSRDEAGLKITCTTLAFSAVAGWVKGAASGDESPEPTPLPILPPASPSSSSGGNSGGGGGGGGGGDESDAQAEVTARILDFKVSANHQLTGAYSGLVSVGSKRVAKLASPAAALSRSVSVPADNYWLDVRVKHDRPGPVKMAVYLNNRAWQVIALTKADNKYYTHRLGLLRNFRQGTIRFRLLNDTFDRRQPSDEEKDRNLFIESWRLTTGGPK